MTHYNKIYKKVETFFGINLDYILRGGSWLGLDQVVSIIISLGLIYVFGNFLDKEVFGTYRYVLSFFGILTIATLPNMNIALITSVSRGFEGMLRKALKTRVVWGLWGTFASISIAAWNFGNGETMLGYAFLLVAAFIPFSDSLNIFTAFMKGRKLFKEQTIYSIVIRIVSAATLIGVVFFSNNLLLLLLAFFLPYVIMRVIIYFRVVKKFKPNDKKDPTVISYGKHLSFIQVMNVIINYLDNILIFHFLGPVALAGYTIALAPIKKGEQAFSIIPDLALPKFSERNLKDTKIHLMKKMLKAMAVITLGVVMYIIFIPYAFRIVLPQYTESIFYSQILSLVLLSLPFGLVYTLLQAHAKKSELYEYNVAIRIIQLTLTIVFVTLYGVIGAVIARILFKIAGLLLILMLFKRL
ncbi:MAG: hypothetical protein COU08_01775 [Candidatus Harrisonbacteria bacterium CG10_big_fil_rev_8_21_14_0_10_42_17]|uniref:Polysaccharide biosynthesis protein C-terminal domain-containing protein n=1 Tax=Candidatus Harrisonbacteria bacterium CG10_big_fil_rev_8_21_14_0_10_42_17 TaxID=1974584 RepID=A0A2M6WIL2_9BACT|nr:MAG: hypothetical protein COU08_01775 [Candidatus Harrisonbacteria bacterium CG10_big_fil_rev_8_21_14_0_10_42_17]